MPEKKNEIVLNLSFQTSPPQITERVIGIAEAFGIGVDDVKTFTVFHNVKLRYNDTDLIYVTGDSGSGKSSFLRIFQEYEKKRRNVLDFEDVKPDPDEVLIDSLGKSLNEASRTLGACGLSEAFIMLRRYKELSEGQKYRYKLAKMIDEEGDVFLIDEFGATLDREMAKVLAYSFQKWARRNQKQLVIASTHTDLLEDFNPDILILKRVGTYTKIQYFEWEPRPFSLLREMSLKHADIEDYDRLEEFHYKGSAPGFRKAMFKLVWEHEIVGIIVYCTPFLRCAGRTEVFPEYKDIKRLNREVLRIARVIVNPKFRGIGVAHRLVRQCNMLVNARVVETLAVMAKYNPFFEKAGMKRGGYTRPTKEQAEILRLIAQKKAELYQLYSKGGRKAFLNSLTTQEMQELVEIMRRGSRAMRGVSSGRGEQYEKILRDGDINALLGRMLPSEKLYLYWVNPKWESGASSSST